MNPTDAQTLIIGVANESSRRIVARLALADGIENTYALLAAVYRLAIRDAKRGDIGATEFLDITAPDWRELSAQHQTERIERARLNATRQTDV